MPRISEVASKLNETLSITVNLNGLDKKLRAFSDNLKKRERINEQIAIRLRSLVIKNFETQSNNGIKWAPFKAGGRWKSEGKGKKRTRTLDRSAKLLQDTGNLRVSFTELWSNDLAGVGAKASAGVNYAIVHEQGSPKNKLPARPMLPTAKQLQQEFVNVYTSQIRRAQRARLGS